VGDFVGQCTDAVIPSINLKVKCLSEINVIRVRGTRSPLEPAAGFGAFSTRMQANEENNGYNWNQIKGVT
jgi:hypothetical protein